MRALRSRRIATVVMAWCVWLTACPELNAQPHFLFWVESGGDSIFRAAVETPAADTVLANLEDEPAGLAVDTLAEKIYWTYRSGRVLRASYDGSNPEVVLDVGICGIGEFTDIEVDARNGKLFWGYDGDCGGNISFFDLDGSNSGLVFAAGGRPANNIAVDEESNRIFFSDRNPPADLVRTNYDGTDVAVLLQDAGAWGVALDAQNQKVYVTGSGRIRRMSLDGTAVQDVVSTGMPQRRYARRKR